MTTTTQENGPVGMRARIRERRDLAAAYTENGDHVSALRVLTGLWAELREHLASLRDSGTL